MLTSTESLFAAVALGASTDEPEECVIMCRKATHCEGCDQCEPTTCERLAHERGKPDGIGLDGAAYLWPRVRWCYGCAETVNAGEHDTYDLVATLPASAEVRV